LSTNIFSVIGTCSHIHGHLPIFKQEDSGEDELSFTLRTLDNGCKDIDIKCMLTNARSIMNKLAELKNYVTRYKPRE